jgi:hypothetical protein
MHEWIDAWIDPSCYVCVDECSRHVRAEWINPNEIAGLSTKRTQIARAGRELCALINYSNLLSARREIRSIVSFPERKSRAYEGTRRGSVINRVRVSQHADRSLQHAPSSPTYTRLTGAGDKLSGNHSSMTRPHLLGSSARGTSRPPNGRQRSRTQDTHRPPRS